MLIVNLNGNIIDSVNAGAANENRKMHENQQQHIAIPPNDKIQTNCNKFSFGLQFHLAFARKFYRKISIEY